VEIVHHAIGFLALGLEEGRRLLDGGDTGVLTQLLVDDAALDDDVRI